MGGLLALALLNYLVSISLVGMIMVGLLVAMPFISSANKHLIMPINLISVAVIIFLPLAVLLPDFGATHLWPELFLLIGLLLLVYLGFVLMARYIVRMVFIALVLVSWVSGSLLLSDSQLAMTYSIWLFFAVLLAFITGSLDYQHRRLFSERHKESSLIALAKTGQADRLAWLENMARFLRHELRNALLGVSTSLDILRRKGVAPEHEVYLQRAALAAFNMKRLLDDSAQASALEKSLAKDQPEMIDLSGWLTERVELYRQQYEGVEFRLAVDAVVRIAATEERLGQLLDKLVNNAYEHLSEGSPIELRLSREMDFALLEVANRGDALPADKESIFQLFASGKEGDGKNIGLGLHIVRLITEAYGGSVSAIDLIDPPGAGFEVRWPLGFFGKRNKAGRG
ncbi:MAG: sensor histidine kinase [Gammaproteobacteria bacterium]